MANGLMMNECVLCGDVMYVFLRAGVYGSFVDDGAEIWGFSLYGAGPMYA